MARKAKMIAQLPPTPCTQEMRDKVVAIADVEGISVAAVQREALSLFFALRGSNATTQSSKPKPYVREETRT